MVYATNSPGMTLPSLRKTLAANTNRSLVGSVGENNTIWDRSATVGNELLIGIIIYYIFYIY
jgi:hypothetical protein